MKKRILSLLLTVLMIISLFSAFSINASAAGTISITSLPVVLFGGGGEYNIVWRTNAKSIGYVTYRFGGKSYTVYDEKNGVVRSDDDTHTVKVPQEHLDAAGSYEVYSIAADSRTDYNIKLSASTSVSSKFTGYHNQKEIKFAFFSDTHLEPHNKKTMTACKDALDNYMQGADVIVLNGDIPNNMPTEAYFDLILEIARTLSDGSIPVLYAKGNHECRGYFAQKLYKYLVFNTNEFYCRWDYGPVSGITIDIGEDKEDEHEEYYGVDDMDHYFEEQYKWLENMGGYTEGSQYHISIGHSPWFIDRYMQSEYAQQMQQYETDLLVCGHTHSSKFDPNGPKMKDGVVTGIPTLHDGGHNDNTTMRTTLVTMSNGNYHYKGFTETGGTLLEGDIATNRKGSSVPASVSEAPEASVSEPETEEYVAENTENEKEPVIPTAAGVSTLSLKGAGDTVSITAKPVVFDCGDYYCVVWQTTAGQECAGYVEIPGVDKDYMDSFAGKLRTETTHSVKIPKDVLDGKNFTVKNRVVTNYAMYGKVSNPPTSYGPYVSGTQIKFLGNSEKKQKSYNILVLSDIADKGIDANKVKSSFSGNPTLIVTLGNMVKAFNTETDFGEYLKYMNIVSNDGAIPVLFLRGENETKGTFAANIARYIRNTTSEAVIGKFYTNAMIGDVTFAGLDTATDSADSAAKYNQYASFDKIRAEQVSWMQNTISKTFKETFNLVFAHGDGLDNYLGVNFTKGFSNLGTNLVVTGGAGKDPSYSGGNSSYATATCGSAVGLMLTCKNNEIVVKTIGEGGKELGTVDVTKAVAPGKPDDDDNNKPDDNNPGGTTTKPDDNNNGGTTTKPNNNGGSTNNNKPNGGGTTSRPNGGNGNTNSGDGTTTYEPGDFDGIDGDMYIRTVPDGWYNDYLSSGFAYEVITTVSANGTAVTEGVFIEIVSNLAGINLTLYSDSTNAEKAASWAEEYGVYSGYIGGDNALTDSVIKNVLDGLFAA